MLRGVNLISQASSNKVLECFVIWKNYQVFVEIFEVFANELFENI